MVVSLTRCTLLHSLSDLKAGLMNVQCRLIRQLRIYKFELSHNATEETENIFLCERWRSIWSQNIVSRELKNFAPVSRTLMIRQNQRWDKSVNFEAVFQAIDAKTASSIQRISGGISISPSNVLRLVLNIGKKHPKLPNSALYWQNIA